MISRKSLLSIFVMLSAVFSGLFLCPSSVSAYSYDVDVSGTFGFNSGSSRWFTPSGVSYPVGYAAAGGVNGIYFESTDVVSHVNLSLNRTIPKGTILTIHFGYNSTQSQSYEQYTANIRSALRPLQGVDGVVILDVTDSNATYMVSTYTTPNVATKDNFVSASIVSTVRLLVTNDTNLIRLQLGQFYLSSSPIQLFLFPGNFIKIKDSSGDIGALKEQVSLGSQQAHSDAEAALQESKKQTSVMEETKDFITDDSTPEASDIANSDSLPSVGLLPAGPLDSLLLLPLNIMNSIFSSLGGACSPVVAPLPYVDQDVTFPCFGDTIYKGAFAPLGVLIGSVGSALILFYYFKHLYKKVDRATSLETTDDDEWGIL